MPILRDLATYISTVTSSENPDPYTVYATILKKWQPAIKKAGTQRRAAGMVLQFLSMTMVLSYDEVKHMFYQELYKELNEAMAKSNVRIVTEDASANDPTRVQVKYGDRSTEKLVTVIRDGKPVYTEPLVPGSDPIKMAQEAIEGDKPVPAHIAAALIKSNERLIDDNKKLLEIIVGIMETVRQMEPRTGALQMDVKGCGTVSHIKTIAQPLSNYFNTLLSHSGSHETGAAPHEYTTDARAESFHHPDWFRAKRSRASEYDGPTERPTASLFRSHGHHRF